MQITIKIGNAEKPITAVAKAEVLKAKSPATHKFNAHAVCILIGIVLLVGLQFITSTDIASICATVPAFAQEGIDWLRDW
jgi:hypothetical protein